VRGLEPSRGSVGGCCWSWKGFLAGRRGVLRAGPRGTEKGVHGNMVCWHGRWQQPKPDCQGEWEGSPSGDGVRR